MNNLTAKPFIDAMLKARQDRGMSEKDLKLFQKSLYGKTATEIKERHAEDQVFMADAAPLVASVPDGAVPPFNGYGSLDAAGKEQDEQTLEGLYS